MANYDSGVKGFIMGQCTVKVFFPVDWKDNCDVKCWNCKLFSRNTGVCQLTKEVSEYPQQYIASSCPLVFDDDIKLSKKEFEE
jgi:hypothetical protein